MKFSADLIDERIEGKVEGEELAFAKGILETKLENTKQLVDILSNDVIAEKFV